MNKYSEVLDFLYNSLPVYHRIGKAAYKANLDNTIALDNFFGNPHKSFKTIHIAGTNGKGSVSHMLASVLQTSGYKVGLYTSPHLVDFRERIKINGKEISKHDVIKFVENSSKIIQKINPSFFEITVSMAFDYFAKEKTDIAVIEVGLGGRLDSTNIINPILSVITNISLDHTDLLGNTKSAIAYEKAGIIKKMVPVVIGTTDAETENIFMKIAKEKEADIVFADKQYFCNYSLLSTEGKQILNISKQNKILFENIQVDLLGEYQKENLLTAITAISELKKTGIIIQKNDLYEGLANTVRNTGLKGRWQVLGANPRIVCDTGHNEGAFIHLGKQIRNTPCKRLHMIIGFVNDKNIEPVLQLLPKEAVYYYTRAAIPRALDENVLKNAGIQHGLMGSSYKSVSLAIETVKKSADKEDFIFIGGSTFIVAEAMKYF
ncbi:MAG: bifunctional folylpolyglutamate synthase/dihydrofolate synthase [Bacteroidales bacterium]|nr:bifunctional folylpolyglutamate synthase/dihydrofolate synthase [Bacteroidales bacterium]